MSSESKENQPQQPSRLGATLGKAASTAKEMLGKAVGSERMQHEGAAGKEQSQAEYAAAQQSDWKEGTKERVQGIGQELKGTLTGDEQQRVEGKESQAIGSTQQEQSHQ